MGSQFKFVKSNQMNKKIIYKPNLIGSYFSKTTRVSIQEFNNPPKLCSRVNKTSALKSVHYNASVDNLRTPDAQEMRKEARAVARYIRGAPSKFRRVLNTIRGRSYAESLMILEYMPYMSCEAIIKCLMSASSNAKNN